MAGRRDIDIVIVGGSPQFASLRKVLPILRPWGRVHLVSSRLSAGQLEELAPLYDELHQPEHHYDGYENFKLFCIRDINRIVSAPWFVKLDADVDLAADWIDYVDETLDERPDAVLFGPHAGSRPIDYRISGSLVRQRLGRDLRVHFGTKVYGAFYVGRTEFFQQHDPLMQTLHDFIYAFVDGRRVRARHLGDDPEEQRLPAEGRVLLSGLCRIRQGRASEDNLRSFCVHAAGAGRHLFVRDPAGRIRVHDKVKAPTRLKRASKWLRSARSQLTP